MSKVRLTNSSLNSYGTRILTDGVDTAQYERNPVMLYMHYRGKVIGMMKNIKKENDEITAEPVFDEATELSTRCKKQFEFGSLRMVSVGIDIIELSDDPKTLVSGQTRMTITKSKLVEVSIVDIGANDDAIVLYKDGKRLNLASGEDGVLPKFLNTHNKNVETKMDLKKISVALLLSESATETEVIAKITSLMAKEKELLELKKQNETMRLSAVTTAVEAAIAAKKITEDKKSEFIELGKKIGSEDLQKVFSSMSVSAKLTDVMTFSGSKQDGGSSDEYKKLSDVPANKLLELRTKDFDTYKKLYSAEYGIECKIED